MFGALVRLYVRDLVRRRLLWGMALVAILLFAIGYWTSKAVEDAMGQGESFSIATRQAGARLDGLASQVRQWFYVAVVLVAAQVAPESRKNGTTQFVLTSGVSRGALARAQFTALGLAVAGATLVVHGGFAVALFHAHQLVVTDAVAAWPTLLVPMLAAAASVFAVSLTAGSIETYLVFFGVPIVAAGIPAWMGTSVKHTPAMVVRLLENAAMLFPSYVDLARWPHLSPARSVGPPFSTWGWTVTHAVLATTFWVSLGLFLHTRHDFGSRTAAK